MSVVRFSKDGERKEMRVIFDGKSEAEALLLALSRLDEEKPCKGENSNICVAEGCYGESCVNVEKGKHA